MILRYRSKVEYVNFYLIVGCRIRSGTLMQIRSLSSLGVDNAKD
jgi:hypothetical protein